MPPVNQANMHHIAKTQRLIAEHTDQLLESLLQDGRIARPNWWVSQRGRFYIFFALLAATSIGSLFYQRWLLQPGTPTGLPNGAQIATAMFAAIVGIFAYYQWIDSRRESSLEKFYERLNLVNSRYYEWEHARQLVAHFWGESATDENFQKCMYVYLELDNIEYMIYRYQLGFVRKPLFRRAVRTFSSRCESKAFGQLARELVNGAGYDAKTVEVVNILVAQSGA